MTSSLFSCRPALRTQAVPESRQRLFLTRIAVQATVNSRSTGTAMTSTTVKEIENAIVTLSADELQELYAWLEQNRPHPFDERIAADFGAGRLDAVIQEALDDGKSGRLRPL